MDLKKLKVIIPVAVVVLVLVIIAGTMISSYNSTVDMREDVDANYAQIVNRLQQRHDKMEQIISAVEGLQDNSEDLYTLITEARAAYAKANSSNSSEDYIEADSLEAQVLSGLLVVIEDNPDFSASGAYYAYINEASAAENTLAVARRDYNEAVREYNAEVKKFPRVLYIGMFGFEKSLAYWQLPDGAGEIPLVDFTD